MNAQDTIRLLVINDSQSEVERLLSMLRNAGKNTRAQHVPSREGLEKLLTEQAWDLLIGLDNAKTCNIKEAIRSIKKLDKDVPVIIQADAEDDSERTIALIDGLKAGARDVVVLDDDQHLLLVMDRELQNLAERRERRTTDRKFNTTERRCQQLLDSSRDAIAYVEDGMFLYLNRSFGEMFGYNDPDDLLVMPMVDVLTEQDQDTFVQFMKNFKLADTSTSQALKVKAINAAGQAFEATFTVTHAVYEEEACAQLLIEGVGAAAVPVAATPTATVVTKTPRDLVAAVTPVKSAAGIDPVTGLHDRRHMMALLSNAVQEAAEKNRYRSLYYISIDRFAQHRTNLGVADTDAMLASVADCLKNEADADAVLAHFNNEEFLLLSNGIDSEQHLKKATALCKKIEGYICSAGTKSVQVTISVGIAPISENATNPDEILKRAHLAADEARAEGRDGVGSRARVYAPKISVGGADTAAILEVIRHALSNDAIDILFQPIISLQGEPEEHYEVFVRILDGAGKALDTIKMFRAVEADRETACKLDRAIILGASRLLALHRAKGHNTRLLFNLTTASILDGAALVPWLGVTFKAGNIPAEAAIFQISEGDATNYLTQAKHFSDALRSMGSQLAIKHFGCSLDPFKTLAHLSNVSLVKVDGSFSIDIQKKSEDSKALKALVKQLGESEKKAIIPFVENATMMALLWQTGAHFIQGNYLQAPAREMNFQFSDE
jgi:diguanylate cyclase (GGDEF)-like protein/PAS domain S-box-containing protein